MAPQDCLSSLPLKSNQYNGFHGMTKYWKSERHVTFNCSLIFLLIGLMALAFLGATRSACAAGQAAELDSGQAAELDSGQAAELAKATFTSAEWRQFRGLDGQGHADAAKLPSSLSEAENIVWKMPIEGCGWSSPVVLGQEIWMTTAISTLATSDETEQQLASLPYEVPSPQVARNITLKAICLDRATGQLLRAITLFQIDETLQICSVNSYASPTPVGEPGRLYCDFGTMGTACLETATGNILWKRRLAIEHPFCRPGTDDHSSGPMDCLLQSADRGTDLAG
jgi:hypothetical protein